MQTFTTTGRQPDELPWKNASWQTIWQSVRTESTAARQNLQWHEHILWYRCQTFKLLSRGIHYDHRKTSISTYQKKTLSEPHWALPLSCCTFTACGSDVHVLNFPIRILMKKMCLLTLMYNRISKGSHSLASHTLHRERKGLVMLQTSSCSHGNRSDPHSL